MTEIVFFADAHAIAAMVVPGADNAELLFRTTALEKVLRQCRLEAQRIPPEDLPLLRTLTWDPRATVAKSAFDSAPQMVEPIIGRSFEIPVQIAEPMDLAKLRQLLNRETLLRALEPHRGRDARIGEWIDRLDHQRGGIEDSGARGLDRSFGVLLDGVAMRGSLRSCPDALRLEDVLDTRVLVLFSLDVVDYPARHAQGGQLGAARHGPARTAAPHRSSKSWKFVKWGRTACAPPGRRGGRVGVGGTPLARVSGSGA